MLTRFLLAALAAALIAALARQRRSLSRAGAIAAIIVGTVVAGAGGWWWGVVLVAFFASASALSHLRRDRPAAVTARGHERDTVQVLANGGLPTLIAAVGLLPGSPLESLRFALFCGAIAAVNADTWATELGRFSRTPPRLITTGQVVAPGVSGGLSLLGTIGSVAGGIFIGMLAAAGAGFAWAAGSPWPLLIGTSLAGLSGSLVDSLLGATVQAAYRCPACDTPTEQPIHICGTPSQLVRGLAWVTNDVVNVAASLTGAIVGGAAWPLTQR